MASPSESETSNPIHIIPLPAELTLQEGVLKLAEPFSFSTNTVLLDSEKKTVGRFLKRLEKRTGLSFLSDPVSNKATLLIDFKSKRRPIQTVREDESYDLVVTGNGITLSAPNFLGILHGLETLLQLPTGDGKDNFVIPCVTIHDKPRFPWRGLMIDACRHWMPVEVIKRNLDGLALAKMNVFHWHLSENQGFRVESKLYPKLQGMGSDGNFYTQDQIREIVSYAHDRGIRVIPEFDMPGHTTAWFPGYPELASAPGPYTIERKFGVFDPCMDPSREEVYQFLDGFIGEMAGLFPDEYFHIGGDEVNGKQWNMNPRIQRFMADHDLKTNEDLQAYFNGRLEKILLKHHKKMMGWDEILHPDLPKTILVQSWRGNDSLAAAAQKGCDTILSNGFYLDLAQPASIHYLVDPIPSKNNLTPEQKKHILGGEACMWSELVSSETIDSRLWPRTLAVAERLWSPVEVRDIDDLYRRLKVASSWLTDLGLTHESYYFPLLNRLAGGRPEQSLNNLADVVEPLRNYQRHRSRVYTSDFPLDRLVDAAKPEGWLPRDFQGWVNQFLLQNPQGGDPTHLKLYLNKWAENDKTLGPKLAKSDSTVEAVLVSRDLSLIGSFGLQAVSFIQSGNAPNNTWTEKALQTLERAQEPRAEVQIAVAPTIRKLVLAASQQDKLKSMSREDWNKSLDDQVTAANPKNW